MAVKTKKQKLSGIEHDDSGQSVLEFLFVLPVTVAVLILMIRSNTAIQMSIVDQKYSRAQILYLSGNGAEYPLRTKVVKDMTDDGMNQLVVGVSEDAPRDAEGGEGADTAASSYYIGRRPGLTGEDVDPGDTISKRLNVRVRNTVTICLPQVSFGKTPAVEISNSGIKYNYQEDPRAWQFCSSKTMEQRG